MIKRNLILIGCCIAFASCNSPVKNTAGDKKDQPVDTATIQTLAANDDDPVLYSFSNDTLTQQVEIKFVSDQTIDFVLTSSNKISGLSDEIKGQAISKEDVEPEIDEDEEGNAYPSQEYHYDKGYSLAFRVAMEKKDKLIVVETDSISKSKKGCPLQSVAILRKVKK